MERGEAKMPNLVGKDLGRYHIIERLGEGGMATVYKAYDTRLERHVAVKIIRSDVGQGDEMLKRFEREAKALAQLTHPNIVHINDYGEQGGVPYVVMDFLPGGTLKQKLGQPMPFAEAARLLAPIARALEYAHQQKIVHRDVKPANILLTQSSAPMLSDFGIAKILEGPSRTELTATGAGIGTPDYMAPSSGWAKPKPAPISMPWASSTTSWSPAAAPTPPTPRPLSCSSTSTTPCPAPANLCASCPTRWSRCSTRHWPEPRRTLPDHGRVCGCAGTAQRPCAAGAHAGHADRTGYGASRGCSVNGGQTGDPGPEAGSTSAAFAASIAPPPTPLPSSRPQGGLWRNALIVGGIVALLLCATGSVIGGVIYIRSIAEPDRHGHRTNSRRRSDKGSPGGNGHAASGLAETVPPTLTPTPDGLPDTCPGYFYPHGNICSADAYSDACSTHLYFHAGPDYGYARPDHGHPRAYVYAYAQHKLQRV